VLFFNYWRSPSPSWAPSFLKLAASLALALENSRLYADVRWELDEEAGGAGAARNCLADLKRPGVARTGG
jgi:hypothetical protein